MDTTEKLKADIEALRARVERGGLTDDECEEIRDAIHAKAFSIANADWLLEE
jgi:hypothetical protein